MTNDVVFAKGEYETKTELGTAKVIVPNDVRLEILMSSLRLMMFEGRKTYANKKCAPPSNHTRERKGE